MVEVVPVAALKSSVAATLVSHPEDGDIVITIDFDKVLFYIQLQQHRLFGSSSNSNRNRKSIWKFLTRAWKPKANSGSAYRKTTIQHYGHGSR